MNLKLKNQITTTFKMHGLTLRSDASRHLMEVLESVDEDDWMECMDRLLEAIQKQSLQSAMVSKEMIESAVEECNQQQNDDGENTFSIIDAFSVPNFTYNSERRKFLPYSGPVSGLHAGADAKAELFRSRYTILHQRTLRHDLFAPVATLNSLEKVDKFQLKPMEYLLGSTSRLGDIIVLGMLTQMKEGKWFIEDTTGAVQLDLSRARLFTENCFVLVEGSYEDEIFHVTACGFPPPEAASVTRSCFGSINFFGGSSATSLKMSSKLRQIEQQNDGAMFVMLSDVALDDPKVMEKLRTLFNGYSETPPTCFILCGNFTSQPYGLKHIKTLKESFSNLADLINEFPALMASSQFVFVPGPEDPGPGHILPRPAIPESITAEIRSKVSTAHFTSNPCRIQYCTQEIVIFREDIIMKMCRNCVRYPASGEIPTHFAKTIISQAHLCPGPLHVEPVYWSRDAAVRVYPLPDVIVSADKYDPFTVTQLDCTVTNPGSFTRGNYIFKVYWPATRQVEDCQIDAPSDDTLQN